MLFFCLERGWGGVLSWEPERWENVVVNMKMVRLGLGTVCDLDFRNATTLNISRCQLS